MVQGGGGGRKKFQGGEAAFPAPILPVPMYVLTSKLTEVSNSKCSALASALLRLLSFTSNSAVFISWGAKIV